MTRGSRAFDRPRGALGVASFRPGFTTRGFPPTRAFALVPRNHPVWIFPTPFSYSPVGGNVPTPRRVALAIRTHALHARVRSPFGCSPPRTTAPRRSARCARATRGTSLPARAVPPPDPPRRSPCLSSVLRGVFPEGSARGRRRRAPARPRRDRPRPPATHRASRVLSTRRRAAAPARRVARRGRRTPPPAIATPPPHHPPLFRGSNTNRAIPEPPLDPPLPAQLGFSHKPRWLSAARFCARRSWAPPSPARPPGPR